MSIELTKDPIIAAQILADLKTKDESLCRYPLCEERRQESAGTGRPSAYCKNPEHNPLTNHRVRQHLSTLVSGVTPDEASSQNERAASPTEVSSLRDTVLFRLSQFQKEMEHYLATLAQMTDPDLAASQIQSTLDRAETRIAEAQQAASAERALRLAADAARQSAESEAQAEHEAAEQAILHMEEAEAKYQQVIAETEQRMAQIQTEHDETITRIQEETARRIEELEQRSKKAVEEAEAKRASAEEEASFARAKASEIEAKAHAEKILSERLVAEANMALQRERAEVDRLRKQLDETEAFARRRAETDRAEYHATLERERTEIDRLREELASTRSRADQLTTLVDQLRGQLVESQVGRREQRQERNKSH